MDASQGYKNKTVLVTGAGGFIGRHLVAALAGAGARTVEVLRAAGGACFDISASEQVADIVAKSEPDIVFNLAAWPASQPFDLKGHTRVTFGGAVNLASACASQGVGCLVQVGSSAEYGDSPVPFCESGRERPLSPYAAAKTAATYYTRMMCLSMGLNAIIVRPTVVYGPGQPPGMLIPYLFDAFLKNTAPATTPGLQTRDFVYVDDLVEALLILGLRPDLRGETFNVGAMQETPVADVVETIRKMCAFAGPVDNSLPYRSPEVMRHCASIEKMAEATGWRPQTSLIEGLKRTLAAIQAQRLSTAG